MSEYTEVDQLFCNNWPRRDGPCVIDQDYGVPHFLVIL
jgi:hypothetical protein